MGSANGFHYVGETGPSVAILMCTMQGGLFLREQIDSIESQTHPAWSIWASDDGSQDDTLAILESCRVRLGAERLTVLKGPANGFVANFLSLTCNPRIVSDYYAYADQDDIWLSDKLSRALKVLQSVQPGVPSLYCSRTLNVDESNQDIGLSPLFTRPPSFANALIQNIAGGNTIVINAAARQLLCNAGAQAIVVSHDWWAYLLVTGCGGQVHYDPEPTVRYRQHGRNLVGTGNSKASLLLRFRMLFCERFKKWNDINEAALIGMRQHLTPENAERLSEFSRVRHGTLRARLTSMRRSGIFRQTFFENLGLALAIFLKKI